MTESAAVEADRSAPGGAKGRLPDFIIIGAMKSGTTTLYEYLQRDRRIFMCGPKEPMFFSRDEVYGRGLGWYRGLFAGAEAGQVCGEASTCYSRWPTYPLAAPRMAEHLPDAKLIYLMRHPVERAYSHYRHCMVERWLRGGGPILSFERALEELEEIVQASRYADQIDRYLERFGRERLLLLTLDELEAGPSEVVGRVQAFVGLEPMALAALEPLRANELTERAGRWPRRLVWRFRWTPGVAQIAGALPTSWRRALGRGLERSLRPLKLDRRLMKRLSPLSGEMRRKLLAAFEEPTRRLEGMMGRDLSAWRR